MLGLLRVLFLWFALPVVGDPCPDYSAEVELVIARYQEDISWSDAFAGFRVVYDKGPLGNEWPLSQSPLSQVGVCLSASTDQLVKLPNVGKDTHTFLYHIATRYDSLAKWTVFFQGRWDDQRFVGVEPRDFLAARHLNHTAFLPISTQVEDLLRYRGRDGYQEGRGGICGELQSTTYWEQKNRERLFELADWKLRDEWWGNATFDRSDWPRVHAYPQEEDNWIKLEHPSGFVGIPWLGQRPDQIEVVRRFWKFICPDSDPRPPRLLYLTNGFFVGLSREAIMRRPRGFYQVLLKQLESKSGPFSTTNSRGEKVSRLAEVLEFFWREIFYEGHSCKPEGQMSSS